jgi:glutamate--cysteine ligase
MSSERPTRNSILDAFGGYGCPKSKWRIGGEYERQIVLPNGNPVTYAGAGGIQWLLENFSSRWDWEQVFEEERPIALKKEGASITLEPGGQFELSGAPHRKLSSLAEEFRLHRRCLLELAAEGGIQPITCGLTPVAEIGTIPWMPKGRYAVMREYLPKRGDLAVYMMKGTASVQCNFDFSDEIDCARKVKLCAGIAPLTTAIFANSPLYANRPNGMMSYRGHIWTRTDPDRTGFPPGLRNDYSHERWVDYLLDVPMMFIHRGEWIHARGRSFRTFMEQGVDGHFADWSDWELHMTSVFPEVRIKRTIEVRGADCVNNGLAVAFCALFTGILYDERALGGAEELVEEFTSHGGRAERFSEACERGMAGRIGGRRLSDWAERLAEHAQGGLGRIEPEAASLLLPLVEQIGTGESPGQGLLRSWQADPSAESVVRHLAY